MELRWPGRFDPLKGLPSKSYSSILCIVRRVLEGSAQILRTASLESPLISVVLPTLNRAALLPESIESVLNQTEHNLELIVVDDGSSDSTGEIIERYAQHDRRITWIRQQNLGLPKGLNNGFRLARGEFFTWTSDDNRYFADACSIMSRALLANPEVGFVFADMVRRRPAMVMPRMLPLRSASMPLPPRTGCGCSTSRPPRNATSTCGCFAPSTGPGPATRY